MNTAGLVLGRASFSNHASGQPAHCADDSRANGLKRLLGMDQRGSQNPGGLGAGLLEERLWWKLPGREGRVVVVSLHVLSMCAMLLLFRLLYYFLLFCCKEGITLFN